MLYMLLKFTLNLWISCLAHESYDILHQRSVTCNFHDIKVDTGCVSEATFICRYAPSQKIGKPNNFKNLGEQKNQSA
jgi:hypothetical protein